jgi:hypothetical protein
MLYSCDCCLNHDQSGLECTRISYNDRMFMNDELGGTFEETVVHCFKIVQPAFRLGTEENQGQGSRLQPLPSCSHAFDAVRT